MKKTILHRKAREPRWLSTFGSRFRHESRRCGEPWPNEERNDRDHEGYQKRHSQQNSPASGKCVREPKEVDSLSLEEAWFSRFRRAAGAGGGPPLGILAALSQ